MIKIRPNEKIDKGNYYEIFLTNRDGKNIRVAKVDKVDYEKIKICRWGYTATTDSTQGFVNGVNISMHILLMGRKKGFVIDHINHDGLDNRRANLRFATKSQNAMNRKDIRGYTWAKNEEKWVGQIMVNYKHICLGYFTNKKDAIKARLEAEIKYFGEYSYKG
jgi:hypothetical protein